MSSLTLDSQHISVDESLHLLARIWNDRRLGLTVAVGATAVLALATGWLTPWGPLTPLHVMVTTVGMVTIGAMVGLALGNRWSLLLAPVAFVSGRVLHGLMVLPALILGAGFGVWLAHRLGHSTAPAPGIPAIILIALTTVGVVTLTVALVMPGRTAPILGPDGQPLPRSIAELATVEIGGVEQVIMLRGRDVDKPVLLHLSGGPGGTDLGAMRSDTGLEVTDYLRDRFGQDRIYLTANSWGTIPSVFAVQQTPELFHAYIGTGQMVNNRATDQMFYEDALAWADTGNDGLAQQIRDAGPPPYDNLLNYEYTVSYEHQWNAYPGVDDLWEMPFNTFVPENNLLDRINALRGMLDVNYFVYPQLQDYDFRRDAPELDVPVYLVLGQYEARARAVPANEWFDLLDAPSKQLLVFEESGHRPSFEQPADFADLMRDVVAASSQGE